MQFPCSLPLPTLPLNWCNWDKPNLFEFSIIMRLAFGKSIPTSITVVETKISIFLLRKSFINYWPECINYDYVLFLEDLKKTSEVFKKMKQFGTGTVSAFYGIHLKYSEIRLLGIDCDYVEFFLFIRGNRNWYYCTQGPQISQKN